MLVKCWTQYASKFGKLSSGHRTGKGQFSFQSQRQTMPKNVQIIAQVHSSHTLAQNSPTQASTVHEPWTSSCLSWIEKRQRNQQSNCQHPLDHRKKQESSRKTSTDFLTTPKPLTLWITTNWKILKEMGISDHLTCLLRNLYAGQEATVRIQHGTGSKLGKESVKAVYCHPAYLTYVQSTSYEMPGWMTHRLELRLLGEISITSDMCMTPPLWQKLMKN